MTEPQHTPDPVADMVQRVIEHALEQSQRDQLGELTALVYAGRLVQAILLVTEDRALDNEHASVIVSRLLEAAMRATALHRDVMELVDLETAYRLPAVDRDGEP